MMSIPNRRRRLAQSLGIAAAAGLMMSAAQRAEALSLANPAASPIAKVASDALVTEVHGGHRRRRWRGRWLPWRRRWWLPRRRRFHGGAVFHGGGGGFHGGGYRSAGTVFHGGGMHRFYGGGFHPHGGARFVFAHHHHHHFGPALLRIRRRVLSRLLLRLSAALPHRLDHLRPAPGLPPPPPPVASPLAPLDRHHHSKTVPAAPAAASVALSWSGETAPSLPSVTTNVMLRAPAATADPAGKTARA